MLAPVEVGWGLTPYALGWLTERSRLAATLAFQVAREPTEHSVHDLRVACRRLCEAVAFFHGVPEVPPLSEVARAARRMAASVRRLREADAMAARLTELDLADANPGIRKVRDRLVHRFQKERHDRARKMANRIGKRAARLDDAIREHRRAPERIAAGTVDPRREADLRAFVDARLAARKVEVDRLHRALRRSRRKPAKEPDGKRLHAVRVGIKHWRYAFEIARVTMPRAVYQPLSIEFRELQEKGGKSQDLADLLKALQKDLSKVKGRAKKVRRVLAIVRAAHSRSAAEFLEALEKHSLGRSAPVLS